MKVDLTPTNLCAKGACNTSIKDVIKVLGPEGRVYEDFTQEDLVALIKTPLREWHDEAYDKGIIPQDKVITCVDFSGSDLSGWHPPNIEFNNCNFAGCDLSWAELNNATFVNCNLIGVVYGPTEHGNYINCVGV